MRTLVLTAAFALAAASPRVSVKVSPQIVFAGNGVTVICTVPRNADNRTIEGGLTNYRNSTIDIEGENAPVTFRFEYKQVPCVTDAAFCTLTDNLGGQVSATTSVLVKGCDTP